jgi:hypothetical protein
MESTLATMFTIVMGTMIWCFILVIILLTRILVLLTRLSDELSPRRFRILIPPLVSKNKYNCGDKSNEGGPIE